MKPAMTSIAAVPQSCGATVVEEPRSQLSTGRERCVVCSDELGAEQPPAGYASVSGVQSMTTVLHEASLSNPGRRREASGVRGSRTTSHVNWRLHAHLGRAKSINLPLSVPHTAPERARNVPKHILEASVRLKESRGDGGMPAGECDGHSEVRRSVRVSTRCLWRCRLNKDDPCIPLRLECSELAPSYLEARRCHYSRKHAFISSRLI